MYPILLIFKYQIMRKKILFLAEYQHYFELIEPSVIICNEKVIERINEALDNVKQQVLIYSIEGKNDEVRKVFDLLEGYDTHPSEFVLASHRFITD